MNFPATNFPAIYLTAIYFPAINYSHQKRRKTDRTATGSIRQREVKIGPQNLSLICSWRLDGRDIEGVGVMKYLELMKAGNVSCSILSLSQYHVTSGRSRISQTE